MLEVVKWRIHLDDHIVKFARGFEMGEYTLAKESLHAFQGQENSDWHDGALVIAGTTTRAYSGCDFSLWIPRYLFTAPQLWLPRPYRLAGFSLTSAGR